MGDLPWHSARINDRITSQLLRTLHGYPPQRELVVRPGSNMGASRFNYQIDMSRRKVEALLIFITGYVPETPCVSCQEHRGPFSFCVQSSAPENEGSCANCWWLTSEESRCSLHGLLNTPADYDSMFRGPNVMINTPGFQRAIRERLEPLFKATEWYGQVSRQYEEIKANYQEFFFATEDMVREVQELHKFFKAPERQGDDS